MSVPLDDVLVLFIMYYMIITYYIVVTLLLYYYGGSFMQLVSTGLNAIYNIFIHVFII